jgi:hypothetical protein
VFWAVVVTELGLVNVVFRTLVRHFQYINVFAQHITKLDVSICRRRRSGRPTAKMIRSGRLQLNMIGQRFQQESNEDSTVTGPH